MALHQRPKTRSIATNKGCWHTAMLALALAWCNTSSAQSRGELLYSTHCGACHSSQMHWRDKKQVLDWTSLRAQVRFWQSQAMLGWNDDDINLVAGYLNDTYYRMPPPAERTRQVTVHTVFRR